MKITRLLPLFLLLPLAGCAKSPAGGPVVRTSNRFQAILSVSGTLNPTYYYAAAFDDISGDGTGPGAILGNTTVVNGVVGGNFRLVILYNRSRFQAFYRSNPSDPSTEREIPISNDLFAQPIPRATANGINFTLNLDATLADGSFIFPRVGTTTQIATDRFDFNCVTTNIILRGGDSNDITKPVDALGAQQTTTSTEVTIASTRSTNIQDATSDENFGVNDTYTAPESPNFVPFTQIDLTGVQISIIRGS